jgi:DNA topoisomerase-1
MSKEKSTEKKKKSSGAETLVIVESPSKARTIDKYLGKDYIISSSVGHIIDLPKSRLAIDIENSFEPEYITIRGKAKILNELKKKASKVNQVLLATDPDREGEAISWHLSNSLSVKNPNIKRIEFNEITEQAIREAVERPREIDTDLVNAQQARRILDRIVGYYISPILWKKVKRGLSAGRVQSVALKVICDREEEIDSFIPKEYWSLDVDCLKGKKSFRASLHSVEGEKVDIKTSDQMDAIVSELEGKPLLVEKVTKKERKRKPQAPYITSKLQQDAANRLGFTSRKTMIVAQQLYEGIDVTGTGPVGLITYMRTDSTRLSDAALSSIRNFIAGEYSDDYLPEKANIYSNRKGAQDAHEAIRPTDIIRTPESIKNDLSREQYRLYDLIWKRTVASQMKPEVSEVTTVDLQQGKYLFRATGSRTLFKGFTLVEKDTKSNRQVLPELEKGDEVQVEKYHPEQHFTTPPPRFNDASLVKFLEESGIGRPSTYSPTIDTLLRRYYVVRQGRQLAPTVLGRLVNDIMKKYFTSLVSIDFTADMEEKLDQVEESKFDWVKMLEDFYGPFKETVDHAEEHLEEMKGVLDEETDIVCEKCGSPMVKKLGRYGFFLACSGFPECRNARPLPLGTCPRCGDGDVVKKSSRKGRGGTFYACSNYPECEFLSRETPADKDCPQCGRLLFRKNIKKRGEELRCLNEECGFRMEILDDSGNGNGNGK